ncbi:hypothetical protein CNR22_08975 [Sphingobacteriaceae bacterium]|nr:hypothetical protein CNR22_08975 [Sphingobacteriaceae bacterium]
MDCGDIGAGYDIEGFLNLQNKVNNSLNLRNVKGAVKFQVLVDSSGRGCVLSHTDRSNSEITLKIIKELNKFKKWTPAITNNKKEVRSAIIVVFTLGDNRVSASIERIDRKALMKSFDRPLDPVIYNTHYTYENKNLDKYKMTVWNSANSDLPNNMSNYMTIDKDELIWLTVDGSLVTFDGKNFKNTEQNITEKGKYFGYSALATDNNNVKWIYAKNAIYSYDNVKWRKYDSSEIGITRALKIINNSATGEVFSVPAKG